MILGFKGETRFLSNFWPAKVTFEGLEFSSVEHAYVAAKTTDLEIRKQIQQIQKAADVKKFGRVLKLRSDWTDEFKLSVMEGLVNQKFQIPELREKLKGTGEQEIIESNYWCDNFFGSCTCNKCGNQGRNELGKLLMKTRNKIK